MYSAPPRNYHGSSFSVPPREAFLFFFCYLWPHLFFEAPIQLQIILLPGLRWSCVCIRRHFQHANVCKGRYKTYTLIITWLQIYRTVKLPRQKENEARRECAHSAIMWRERAVEQDGGYRRSWQHGAEDFCGFSKHKRLVFTFISQCRV